VAQLNGATGAVNWSQTLPGTGANSVAVDGAGAAYVISHGILVINGKNSGYETYVTKFDPSGTQMWQDTLKADIGIGADATVAVSGNAVYIGGLYDTQVKNATFVIGPNTYTVTSQTPGTEDAYVLKLSTDNSYGWVQTIQCLNANSGVWSNSIAADSAGNVYSFGYFWGKVDFAPVKFSAKDPWVLSSGKSSADRFVAKLTPSGGVAWAEQFGDFSVSGINLGNEATAIAVDGAGAVYLTGNFSGTTSFNPAGGGTLTSAGGYDVFVSKLNTNGIFQWAVKAGGTGNDLAKGIAVSVFGDVFITGSIDAGTAYFDPTHSLTTPAKTGFLWQIKQP
jgi:hypothetical protein